MTIWLVHTNRPIRTELDPKQLHIVQLICKKLHRSSFT